LSKVLEDLLKRSLRNTVLLNVELLLLRLNKSEEETNGFVFTGSTQFVEVSTLLEKIDRFEQLAHSSNEFETICLSVAELNES